MTWKKRSAIKGEHGGCLNCGPRPDTFTADMRIGVGFGYADLLKDGVSVWSENQSTGEWEDCMSGAQAEELAAADPDHDWQIAMQSPLSGRTYQRHDAGLWVLVEQNMGFEDE